MSFNATVVGSLSHLTASQLYSTLDIDYTQINWFERQWMAWYLWIGNPIIATGIASLLLHETVYFGRCIPWIIIDAIPYFRRWKLQPAKVPTSQEQWECTKGVLFSHFTVEAPAIFLFHPVAESFGMNTWQVPFPSWQTMLPQLAFFFVFEDMFHYFSHQLLHTPLLYKHIHKLHHKYSAPFGLAAEYAHPLEVMILGTGTILGPLLYCKFTQNLHIVTVYIWITLRLFQAIDAHSGYDFPWSLQHIVPFWSGAEHHDFHHMAFVNNFSTSFRWWDRILGTDSKYRAYRQRISAATRGLDEAHRKVVEDKLVAEEEEAGFAAEKEVERKAEGKKNQ
ncbi:C-4 methyl sterol oxidase [Lactarius quietus]|nr:C-4 methyl sterol oxidase [Lactarius quietus]